MSISRRDARSLQVSAVLFEGDFMQVMFRNGWAIRNPLAWYPRLQNATSAERENWRILPFGDGIHWEDIDEDLSIEGMLSNVVVRDKAVPRQEAHPLQ